MTRSVAAPAAAGMVAGTRQGLAWREGRRGWGVFKAPPPAPAAAAAVALLSTQTRRPIRPPPTLRRAPMPLQSGECSSCGGSNGIQDDAMASLDDRRRQRVMPLWGLATRRALSVATAPHRVRQQRCCRRRFCSCQWQGERQSKGVERRSLRCGEQQPRAGRRGARGKGAGKRKAGGQAAGGQTACAQRAGAQTAVGKTAGGKTLHGANE